MMKRKLMMMMNTLMMKKNNFKSVSIVLYTGGTLINDKVFNALNNVTGGVSFVNQYWDTFYEPINSRVFTSRVLIRNITLDL